MWALSFVFSSLKCALPQFFTADGTLSHTTWCFPCQAQRIWPVSATTAACKQLEGDKLLKYEETTPTPSVKAQVIPLPEIIMNKCRVCEPWVADLEFTVKGSQAFKPGGWLCRDNKRITSKKSLCFVCSDFTQPALHGKYFRFKPVPIAWLRNAGTRLFLWGFWLCPCDASKQKSRFLHVHQQNKARHQCRFCSCMWHS